MKEKLIKTQKWYDKTLIALIFALPFFLVFFHSTRYFSVFTGAKLLSLRLITLMMILSYAYKIYEEKKIELKNPKFYLGLAVYGFMSLLNTFISVNTFSSIWGIEGRFLGIFTVLNFLFIAFITCQVLNEDKIRKLFLKYLSLIGLLVAIYGLLQYYKIIGDATFWDQDPTQRVFGTFGHSNHFAAWLGISMSISVGLFFYSRDKLMKVIYGITIIIAFWTILATASRGGLGASLIALMFFTLGAVFIYIKNIQEEGESKIKKLIGTIIASLIILIALSPIAINKFKSSYLYERMTSLKSSIEQGYLPDRVSWWLSMGEMIADKPFFGHGLSTFKDIYNQYRRLDYRNADDLQYEVTPESGHMEYLSIAATQGIFGLIAYLLPILYVFYLAYKFTKNPDNEAKEKLILLGLISALIVYLSQVLLSFGVVSTWSIFFILLGLAASMVAPETKSKTIELSKNQNLALVSLMIVLTMILTNVTWDLAKSQRIQRIIKITKANGHYQETINEYNELIAVNENNAFYHNDYAEFLIAAAASPQFVSQKEAILKRSIEQYQLSIDLNNHHPYFFANLGVASIKLAQYYEGTGQAQEVSKYLSVAIAAYEMSVEKGPNNPLHLYNMMKIYALVGSFDNFYQTGDKILEIRTDYKDTLVLLIKIAMEQNNQNKIDQYLNLALKEYPDNETYLELKKAVERQEVDELN